MKNNLISTLSRNCRNTFTESRYWKEIKINIPKSEFLKIKTYDIIIQGDDTWNKDFADKKKHHKKI
jgi:hypothetical protein